MKNIQVTENLIDLNTGRREGTFFTFDKEGDKCFLIAYDYVGDYIVIDLQTYDSYDLCDFFDKYEDESFKDKNDIDYFGAYEVINPFKD